MKKIVSRIIDIILILLIIYLSYRVLQKQGIIDTKIDKMNKIPSFSVDDMEGNKITEDIFKKYDFTIINIWSPLCGACIEGLEALEELEPYIKEKNGNTLGIVTNATKSMAENKIDEMDIRFTNIIPDRKLNKELVREAMVTPTILFVDKSGNILEVATGSYIKDEEVKFLKKKIDQLKNKGVVKK